jgi:predicted nucleic-acid-binding protein
VKVRTIDANVILRFLLDDHPEQSPRCRELLRRVQDGEETIFLPEVVVSDTVWTLQRFYRWPPDRIRRFVGTLLDLDGVRVNRKATLLEALHLFATLRIDFSDALIAAEMLRSGREEIYSYDRDFDRVPGLRRVDP